MKEKDIESFLYDIAEDYKAQVKQGQVAFDFRPLYAKHPKIRICCRRALLVAQKRGYLNDKE